MLCQRFLEIARQNWNFKIGLSLFDFKQLLFYSGNIVHCNQYSWTHLCHNHWSSVLSQYWLIVVFLSWTDKQQTSVSSACKSLRRLIFYFMQILVRSQPFLFLLERVSVEATWALGWVDHWATPAMRWTTFSQMKRKTRYIQTGTLIHFPIQRIREIGMQRDGEIYVWYFHFFVHIWIRRGPLASASELILQTTET